ncbi:30S ribosomal protein S4 [Clostridium manihotivorum]|uniref:Small ribosomal subunit protein uS4 n=1 Tax=Clostridium manihotivorum TaxID=2320868 RepID=A0A3R5THP0_9CLOT|nr:30S ribosomal protein S4 [Clostridium manihotivorum]QAA33693.1 30S ribosomal protein S4 [Clostridium manihotivorum]
MARPRTPRFKLSRHLGVNVFNHPKALNRGIKKHKLSEYGEQLLEKQKLKAYYGVMEKQFRRYVRESLSAKERPEQLLIQNLERRLDSITYRLGFAPTLRMARQMVNHGHILVNGNKVDIPSYRVNVNDLISLKEKSRKIEEFVSNFTSIPVMVPYMSKDSANFSGTLVRLPLLEEVPIDVRPIKVFEFYSRV